MSTSSVGLIVFIGVVALNILGLLLDRLLELLEVPTITEHVWDMPILGVPIVLVQIVGLAGLLVHFYAVTK